ncbi:hypothetical protein Q8F55_002444 [Vanrija albida]|uniref:DNA polymerase n=1 Tax=Vanrija albida TaxID=181172 RepID=A0ABR3QAT5_9TREE
MLRPPLRPSASSSSSVSRSHSPPRAPPVVPLFAELAFYVVPSKLEGRIASVYAQIDALGGRRVAGPEEADYVLTALHGLPRLQRALGPNLGALNLLRVEFVADTYARAVAPASFPRLPAWAAYRVATRKRSPSVEVLDGPPAKKARGASEVGAVAASEGGAGFGDWDAAQPPDVAPYTPAMPFKDIPRLACERPCPLTCPNQDIVGRVRGWADEMIDAIKPIFEEREYDEPDQLNSNVLSYRRSMSIMKSAPRRFTSGKDARQLNGIGDKVAARIDEYLATGAVAESDAILSSTRFKALRLFSTIYTIGRPTAADLYDKKGCRTLSDVEAHYCSDTPADDELSAKELRARDARRISGTMTRGEVVRDWIGLRADLDASIPRDEVEAIGACVAEQLDALCPGCEQTICGGYRRGKKASNDVDVIFRPPRAGLDERLVRRLYARLAALGIVTHVLHVSTLDHTTPLHAHPGNFDNLDKAFVILRLPPSADCPAPLHRRVDLICAPPERYAAAVLSWSGSMMFERDLRRYVEARGLKFRAGLIDAKTNEEINFATEREIFAHVGLRYVPPELRNADG